MNYIIVFIVGYLIGSINPAIIVGRLWKNIDVREYGSGNAGATNVLRTLGVVPAILVVIGDLLKGIIGVILGGFLTGNEIGKMLGGLAAVIGHNWPLFFQFRGGKGILTSTAVILMIAPQIAGIVVIISIVIIALTRYVSLGSLVGAILFPLLVVVIEFNNTKLILFGVVLSSLAIYRHRENIKRLIRGTERKLGDKKKDKER